MTKIAIIVGSTRPGRRGRAVAEWVADVATQEHPAVDFELLDLVDVGLPLLDEEQPALFGQYGNEHTARWAKTIGRFDGFVFVTPEYNHSVPGALKNALDFVYAEWNNKAAGFVSYGLHGGTRAVEHLRLILAELKVATVRTQVALSLFHDFTIPAPAEPGTFTPGPHQGKTLTTLLDEVVTWSSALQPVREGALA
ncbi:NADPH-dependent FMN reductase [Nonomuraea sp. NEAU-A123]|uniref:NADPH-dependent FMN reductase n=1 Tax=Nonomuraea sp. NEAU-A123 TaxID=2839649 RepID=UPI001BE4B69E|nr:NAD(P)H-dependent oxidoreductase [Nonomuraea sp. NEAU-A123]MBT2224324.1 NAD(P)H-dependent oxidoreductase [Nonomuraea sp. NEAU-A123]